MKKAKNSKVEKSTDSKKPGHYGGLLGWGYELKEDGTYQLAPVMRSSFKDIMAEHTSLTQLVNSVLDHANSRLTVLEKEKTEWFHRVATNLGIDTTRGQRLRYDWNNNILTPEPPPPPQPQPTQGSKA